MKQNIPAVLVIKHFYIQYCTKSAFCAIKDIQCGLVISKTHNKKEIIQFF